MCIVSLPITLTGLLQPSVPPALLALHAEAVFLWVFCDSGGKNWNHCHLCFKEAQEVLGVQAEAEREPKGGCHSALPWVAPGSFSRASVWWHGFQRGHILTEMWRAQARVLSGSNLPEHPRHGRCAPVVAGPSSEGVPDGGCGLGDLS